MPINYNKLFKLMDEKGINKAFLRKNGIHANTVDRLIHNKSVNTDIIERLCELLDCRVEDIMEYTKE